VIFFTDRDLGTTILPAILRNAGFQIERHVDHFAPDAPDAEWIPAVGARGWYVLTRDQRIRYVRAERDAVMRAHVGMFVMVGKASHQELALNVVNTKSAIEAFALEHPAPFIARIYRPSPPSAVSLGKPGRVELWLDRGSWTDK
jgi:hypothetical protein